MNCCQCGADASNDFILKINPKYPKDKLLCGGCKVALGKKMMEIGTRMMIENIQAGRHPLAGEKK